MIYCVKYDEVRRYLLHMGYSQDSEFDNTILFTRGREIVTLRRPNVDGNVPEMLVNGALEAAGLNPPMWSVFWCD